MSKASVLIRQIKKEIQLKYGVEVNLGQIVNETLQLMINSGNFSAEEIEKARHFYADLIETSNSSLREGKMCFRSKKSSKSNKHESLELELPPKMAMGFVCMLAGGLVCIIPGAQVFGAELILIGGGLALDGLAEGERPYYMNPANGEKYDFGKFP